MGEHTHKIAFFKKKFKIITKENLSKSIKSTFSNLASKFRRKVEIPAPATYELSLEFRSYDEDEEDTYSVVMSMESIERRLQPHNDAHEEFDNRRVHFEDPVEDFKSLDDLINSLNRLLLEYQS